MNKIKWLFFGAFVLSINICSAQGPTNNYIEKFLPMADSLSVKWGIPVSIILGVSILESGSGTSINCRQLHNYFGVKGHNHLKKRHTKYKQYSSAEESFKDFCRILSTKKYYSKLRGTFNYKTWLTAMNKRNYAGAKEVWIERIKFIIVKHKLRQYDQVDTTSATP